MHPNTISNTIGTIWNTIGTIWNGSKYHTLGSFEFLTISLKQRARGQADKQ